MNDSSAELGIEPEDSTLSTDVGETDAAELLGDLVAGPSVEVPLDDYGPESAEVEVEENDAVEPIQLVRKRVRELEVSIAMRSESFFWEGLDDEYGVFLATYEELRIGTRVQLTVHLPGGESFRAPAIVRWVRPATPDHWPGLGFELPQVTYPVARKIERFKRFRPSLFYAG